MTPPALQVRASRTEDMGAVQSIYADEVLTGTATFELVPPGVDEMWSRHAALCDAGYPYLVAELEGRIAGYGYAGPYRPRAAYRHTVEDSIYIAAWARRRGAGAALLDALIATSESLGFRQMVAVIADSAHVASIKLHERAGFRVIGTFQSVGHKQGRWLDTVLMQRALGAGDASAPERE